MFGKSIRELFLEMIINTFRATYNPKKILTPEENHRFVQIYYAYINEKNKRILSNPIVKRLIIDNYINGMVKE